MENKQNNHEIKYELEREEINEIHYGEADCENTTEAVVKGKFSDRKKGNSYLVRLIRNLPNDLKCFDLIQ